MYDSKYDLLVAYRATPDTLPTLLRDCSPGRAATRYGGERNWSVVEVICHMRDAEERALERMRAMRDQSKPFLPAYDQDKWAAERNYIAQDLQEALTAFLRYRAIYLAELGALSPQQWERVGEHEEEGQIDIFSHLLHMVSHDSIHLAQIARQLEGRA
jgi:hypothetical protein